MDELAELPELTPGEAEAIESSEKEWQKQALLHWSRVVKAARTAA